ncbi:MAG: right-handed parallel beta-helix repeat-containing protein, partial [Bacteroidota bacterium]
MGRLMLLAILALIPLFSAASTFTVANVLSTGSGSLDAAIQNANAMPGSDTIHFNIPGAGPHTIATASTAITEAVFIDGTSQPGYVGIPLIQISQPLQLLAAQNCHFQGLQFFIFCTNPVNFEVNDCIIAASINGGDQVSIQQSTVIALILENFSSPNLNVSNNNWPGGFQFPLEIRNCDSLIIAAAGVANTNVELNFVAGYQRGILVSHSNAITFDGVDILFQAPNTNAFYGIRLDTCEQILIQNCRIERAEYGVRSRGSSDLRILNNAITLSDSGGISIIEADNRQVLIQNNDLRENRAAIALAVVETSNLLVTGNQFTPSVIRNTAVGLAFEAMNNLRISDGSLPNSHVILDSLGNDTLSN